ncbi:hypothetical protein BDV93DRAFT_528578 [Ceratobasidium sp. AG-I]|nr:hypothetical protein BDV93DRAFT_528578 [Ceratobasidium sp. AG-I]
MMSDVSDESDISEAFLGWAEQVCLDTEIRRDNFPEALTQLLESSKFVPGWIYDQESPKYGPCKVAYGDVIPYLVLGAEWSPVIRSEDPKLSNDTELVLPRLLNIVTHHINLAKSWGLPTTDAERRHALDALGFCVWDRLASGEFRYTLERSLQLPETKSTQLRETSPDSAVFFRIKRWPTMSDEIDLACSSLARASRDKSLVLHWATEFKQDHSRGAEQKLFRALVSGLYQRRALGFLDHFVFGTAHHSGAALDVFAATWEVPKEGQESTGSASQQEIPGSEAPDIAQKVVRDSFAGIFDMRSEGKDEGLQAETADETNNDGQIVVYHLGTFNMEGPADMLRLYLLMRSTRSLADQYCEEIDRSSIDRILIQHRYSRWIYDWPALLHSQASDSNRSGRGWKRRKPDSGRETKKH